MATSVTTTSLEDIKKWAIAKNGKPVRVKDSRFGLAVGVISIYFPGFYNENNLVEISWEEWYDIFNLQKLEFLYRDHVIAGQKIAFFQLVNRN